jgi:hypothetical protein
MCEVYEYMPKNSVLYAMHVLYPHKYCVNLTIHFQDLIQIFTLLNQFLISVQIQYNKMYLNVL